MVIILMEVIKNFVDVVIILMEVIINFVEVIKNFVEVVINLSEMVRRVAGRIWGIIGMVVGMATVKDRTLGTASSVGSIDGVVVVATADYTLLLYISGRVCSAGRSINTMARRSSMLGGRGCVMGRRINIMLGRGSTEGANGQHEGRNWQHGGRERANVSREGKLGGRECSDKGNKKGEYRSTPLGCIANINYSATVTVARRLKETGDSSSTPPLPLVVMLSRLTPILTSSSATVSARFSDSAWL